MPSTVGAPVPSAAPAPATGQPGASCPPYPPGFEVFSAGVHILPSYQRPVPVQALRCPLPCAGADHWHTVPVTCALGAAVPLAFPPSSPSSSLGGMQAVACSIAARA